MRSEWPLVSRQREERLFHLATWRLLERMINRCFDCAQELLPGCISDIVCRPLCVLYLALLLFLLMTTHVRPSREAFTGYHQKTRSRQSASAHHALLPFIYQKRAVFLKNALSLFLLLGHLMFSSNGTSIVTSLLKKKTNILENPLYCINYIHERLLPFKLH
jgi:hypothetical protein